MSRSAWVMVGIASITTAGCHRAESPRERALSRLPGVAQLVAVADGAALADPGVRRAIDALRPRVADSLGCVIDAALAADAVAIAATRTTGALIVIAAPAPPRCPALARVDDGLWVATIGDATVAPAGEASVLAVSRWARARRYLETAPLALALDLGGPHVIAGAQVQPFAAWVALDAPAAETASIETAVQAQLTAWSSAGIAPAAKLSERRVAGQLVVRADGLDGDELARVAPALLDALDPPPAPAQAPSLDCPKHGVVRCLGPTSFDVASVPDALAEMLLVPVTPIAASGAVGGLRLDADAPLLLRRGDVVLGVDGVPVHAARDLADLAKVRSRSRAAVAIRRAGVDLVVVLERRY